MRRGSFELRHGADPAAELQLPVERGRQGRGVGSWVPATKHTYLCKYIEGTRNMRRRWPQRVYVDLFCAAGRIQVEGEGLTRHGGAPLAWLHSQKGDAAFSHCIVGDIDPVRANACGERLRRLDAPVQVLVGPAEQTAADALRLIPRSALTLVFLDPYNLEFLSFQIIERLASLRKVDFAVHFSTMDLRRNVLMEFNPERARFDAAAPGWREHIDPAAFIRGDADDAFFDYWCGLIRSLGFIISDRIPLVRDDGNRPLYHLVFFSRDERPGGIWSDVAQGPNRELF